MKYAVQQKVLTVFRNQYDIKDETENSVFYVKSNLTFPYKLTFYNEKDEIVLQIKKRYFRILKRYDINMDKKRVLILKRRIGIFQKRFKTKSKTSELDNLKIQGDIIGFNFKVTKGETLIASVGKKFLSVGDKYAIDIQEKEHSIVYLALVIVIDDILHKNKIKVFSIKNLFH